MILLFLGLIFGVGLASLFFATYPAKAAELNAKLTKPNPPPTIPPPKP